jgi:pyruvate/2-oxoglutarate dehydrogenase complex dihydrolipoamide acyltransferase (E2) component
VINVNLPQLFPTMTQKDGLTIEKWYVHEGDVIQPGDLLVSIEGPPGFFDIPTPPTMATPCRVIRIVTRQGESVHLNDLLLILQPEEQTAEQ